MAEGDHVDELRERLRATQEAAQRLADVPPGGWDAAHDRRATFEEELQSLARLVATVRELLPDEMREQLNELVRELLLLLRAIIDVLVARLEAGERPPPPPPPPVQDIPLS